jgi:hypothetical protein
MHNIYGGRNPLLKQLSAQLFGAKAQKVHTSFLRITCGVSRGVLLYVSYRDMYRLPVLCH